MSRTYLAGFVAAGSLLGLPACGDDDPCDPAAQTGCADGQVCEPVQGEEPACFAPVLVRGDVFDLADDGAIEGARVVALDANGAAASSVDESDGDGAYELWIPSTRQSDGTPIGIEVTLRADAAGFQSFPGGVRQALPIDTGSAVREGDGAWVVDGTPTDVGLIGLPAGAGTGTISGTVELPDGASALVVAETGGAGHDAVVDRDGAYVLFNLPAGAYSVAAYATGLVHDTADVELADGGDAVADLALLDGDGAGLSGTVQIVNAPGGSTTSVVLFVASTFNPDTGRGAAPPGLRAGEVSGGFSIAGVPPGRYAVLAAFENDALVRDPDTCIAGTEIVYVDVAADDLTLDESFKVTEALEILTPGDGEAITGTPTFSWADDSSEDLYRVRVIDSFGIEVWNHEIPGVSGQDPSLAYAGDPLQSGMYYQVRVQSVRESGGDACEISQSEDLKGVFFVP